MIWAEVPIGVVNAVTSSVLVTCTVVVGGRCAAVKVDISVVALWSSVLGVLDKRSVVFCVVISLAVVPLLVGTIVAFR